MEKQTIKSFSNEVPIPLHDIIDVSIDPFFILDPLERNGIIIDANEAMSKATGIKIADLLGHDFAIYFKETYKAREAYESIFSKTKRKNIPLTIENKNGASTFVLLNFKVYKDANNKIMKIFASAHDVTALQTLKFARSLLELSVDALFSINPEGFITDVNEATVTLTGVTKKQLIGSAFASYFLEMNQAENLYQQVFKEGQLKNVMLNVKQANGTLIPVTLNLSVYKDESENVMGICVYAHDTTYEKQASFYLRSLIDNSIDAFLTLNLAGKILDVNPATAKLLTSTRDKIIHTDFADYFTEPEKAKTCYELVLSQGTVRDYALTLKNKPIHLHFNASQLKDEQQNIIGVVMIARDMSAQNELLQYQKALLQNLQDPLFIMTTKGQITEMNDSALSLIKQTREVTFGQSFFNLSDDPESARDLISQTLKTGGVLNYPLTLKHHLFSFHTSVYRDEAGEIETIAALGRNISEYKKMEETLHHHSAFTRSILELSIGAFFEISLNDKIMTVNHSAEKLTERTREWLLDADFLQFFSNPQSIRAALRTTLTNGHIEQYPVKLKQNAAEDKAVLLHATVFKDAKNNPLSILIFLTDDTASNHSSALATLNLFTLMNTVNEISEMNKSAILTLENTNQELDAFTYSIAHDLKSPLRAIEGFAKILSQTQKAALDYEGQQLLTGIIRNTTQMNKLIEELLTLSHLGKQPLHKEMVDMKEMVNQIYQELIIAHPLRNITLKLHEIPPIKVDRALMKQVWFNLISNAIKFTQTENNALIEVGFNIQDNHTQYYIKDNGLGFDMKYAENLFGVFQRLHGKDIEGTGIGLANVKRIIMRHGGTIQGKGKIGAGAIFTFSLPIEKGLSL